MRKVLKSIKIEIEQFDGCNFPGCKVFELEGSQLTDQGDFDDAFLEIEELLDPVEVGDDPGGPMVEQLKAAARDLLDADHGEVIRRSLVMAGGRSVRDFEDEEDEEEGNFDPIDVTAWVVTCLEDIPAERITVEIEDAGPAFEDAPASEIARILRQLADEFEENGAPRSFTLYDSNGDRAGRVNIDPLEEDDD